jgi:hypothetical protein
MREAASPCKRERLTTCWAVSETRHTEHRIIHFETQVGPCLGNADTTFHPLVLRIESNWSLYITNRSPSLSAKRRRRQRPHSERLERRAVDLIRILRLANANDLRTLNVAKGVDWRVLTDFRRFAMKPVRKLCGSFPSRCHIHYGVLLHVCMHPTFYWISGSHKYSTIRRVRNEPK